MLYQASRDEQATGGAGTPRGVMSDGELSPSSNIVRSVRHPSRGVYHAHSTPRQLSQVPATMSAYQTQDMSCMTIGNCSPPQQHTSRAMPFNMTSRAGITAGGSVNSAGRHSGHAFVQSSSIDFASNMYMTNNNTSPIRAQDLLSNSSSAPIQQFQNQFMPTTPLARQQQYQPCQQQQQKLLQQQQVTSSSLHSNDQMLAQQASNLRLYEMGGPLAGSVGGSGNRGRIFTHPSIQNRTHNHDPLPTGQQHQSAPSDWFHHQQQQQQQQHSNNNRGDHHRQNQPVFAHTSSLVDPYFCNQQQQQQQQHSLHQRRHLPKLSSVQIGNLYTPSSTTTAIMNTNNQLGIDNYELQSNYNYQLSQEQRRAASADGGVNDESSTTKSVNNESSEKNSMTISQSQRDNFKQRQLPSAKTLSGSSGDLDFNNNTGAAKQQSLGTCDSSQQANNLPIQTNNLTLASHSTNNSAIASLTNQDFLNNNLELDDEIDENYEQLNNKQQSQISGLTKKSSSVTQLSMTGTKKRLGFRKKQPTSFSVHRSEEVSSTLATPTALPQTQITSMTSIPARLEANTSEVTSLQQTLNLYQKPSSDSSLDENSNSFTKEMSQHNFQFNELISSQKLLDNNSFNNQNKQVNKLLDDDQNDISAKELSNCDSSTSSSANFVAGLGKGQMISRQELASPYLGDIQLSLCDRRGNLEVEVVRARNLQRKPLSKPMPLTYVKLYLVKNRKCLAKAKTSLTQHRGLNPMFQQLLYFHENYRGCILQAIVWGNYSRLDKKRFLGIVQISIDDLDLSETILCWYKLFLPSSLLTMPSKSLRQTLVSSSSDKLASLSSSCSSTTTTITTPAKNSAQTNTNTTKRMVRANTSASGLSFVD